MNPQNKAACVVDQDSLLTRALLVLHHLETIPAASQEKLVRLTGVPKSSLRRILLDMVSNGLLFRDEAGLFSARKKLVSVAGEVLRLVPLMLEELAQSGEGTAEWYEPSAEGMVLTRRYLPSGAETGVVAKEGYLREWGKELDAVASLGEVFFRTEKERKGQAYIVYVEDGVTGKLTDDELNKRLARAGANRIACDAKYNLNNVKRYAVIIKDGGEPVGVLALAVVAKPKAINPSDESYLACLLNTVGAFFPEYRANND